MQQLQGHSITLRIVLEQQIGRKVLTLQSKCSPGEITTISSVVSQDFRRTEGRSVQGLQRVFTIKVIQSVQQ